MATPKMGLTGLPATGLVAKAQGLHDSMEGNAKFPNAVPTPPAFQSLIDTLAAANGSVDQNGGKVEHQARRAADKAMRAAIKEWAGYVQMASLGDAATILSSGFEVVKRGAALPAPNPPQLLEAVSTLKQGRASFRWHREVGTDLHHVFMSTGSEPFKWELIGNTTKSRFDVDGLEPRAMYWFAVTAIGAAGESSKSEPVIVMAAA